MGLYMEYRSYSEVRQQAQDWQDKVLGIICFSEFNPDSLNEIPEIHLDAPVLAGENIACEVWLSNITSATQNKSSNQVLSGSKGAIQYRLDGELLFGVITLDELAFSPMQSQQAENKISPLQQATESAYRQIFELIDELGYPHLYRFWNYMANINEMSHDLERYRQFNVGRKHILMQSGREVGCDLPAACALGLAKSPLSIAFLVGKTAAAAIENPRQIKAYDYPSQYGPRTPSFSRAVFLHNANQATLFISGTASIVGHQTQHVADVTAQTKETLLNIEALIAQANSTLSQPVFNLHDTFLRVYLRHAEDLNIVRAELQNHLKSEVNALFIQADICRHELLVEIEATIQYMAKPGAAELGVAKPGVAESA